MYRTRMNEYYPEVVRTIKEFQAIIDAEYPEFENLGEANQRIIDDAYLLTMSEERTRQWESVLGIEPIDGSSLSDRRDTVMARIRGQGKLNSALINSIVNSFTGGTANSWVKDSVLYVEVTPPPGNKQFQFKNVEQELALKVPAHLGFKVERNYYEWGEVMSKYSTWKDVKDNFEAWEYIYIFQPFI